MQCLVATGAKLNVQDIFRGSALKSCPYISTSPAFTKHYLYLPSFSICFLIGKPYSAFFYGIIPCYLEQEKKLTYFQFFLGDLYLFYPPCLPSQSPQGISTVTSKRQCYGARHWHIQNHTVTWCFGVLV